MKYVLVYTLGIMALFVVLLFGCSHQTTQTQPQAAEQLEVPVVEGVVETVVEPEPTTPTTEPTPEPTVREISVTAKQWEFIPNPIEVNEGDTVILKIKSIDVAHGIRLPAFGINERLSPGKEVTVQFVADKAGELDFWCNVPCGSGHSSMRGKLIVR